NSFQSGYHTYTTTWTSTSITWSVDGVSYGTVTPSTPPIQWVYNHPFFILLNLAVGSSGSPFPDAAVASDYPQSLYVDYVKVWQTTPSTNPYPTTYGTSTPFAGTAYAVPGKIEVEHFDKGG